MNESQLHNLYTTAISLLKQLVETPSFSREEQDTAALIAAFFTRQNIPVQRLQNNVWAFNRAYDPAKPTILLNSHHDTVKPSPSYTRAPFAATEENGKLYGLGSNDAGGPLVALIATFLHFYDQDELKYNLLIAATAEEEISGRNGIEAILPSLPFIDGAIVGEPTLLQMAVAERGLIVLDGVATGKAGHAARNEGENALYKALADIETLREYTFERNSPFLGPVTVNVTVIETANKTHNIIPSECRFTADVRVNELYTLEEVITLLQQQVSSMLTPRSIRLRSSHINEDHPLVQAGKTLGLTSYGSPTTSDKALMPFPALKIGPGDSARSHTADEFIYTEEIRNGITTYIQLLEQVLK
jgi:acetylornithine deacetylase